MRGRALLRGPAPDRQLHGRIPLPAARRGDLLHQLLHDLQLYGFAAGWYPRHDQGKQGEVEVVPWVLCMAHLGFVW